MVHLDCLLHSPVSSLFLLCHISVSSHIKQALPFTVPSGADKSLPRRGRKQSQKDARDPRDFNNIETRDVIKVFFLQGKAPEEIHNILTETSACYFLGWAKKISPPLYGHAVICTR